MAHEWNSTLKGSCRTHRNKHSETQKAKGKAAPKELTPRQGTTSSAAVVTAQDEVVAPVSAIVVTVPSGVIPGEGRSGVQRPAVPATEGGSTSSGDDGNHISRDPLPGAPDLSRDPLSADDAVADASSVPPVPEVVEERTHTREARLREVAKSMDHHICNFPKNPYCDICNGANVMQKRFHRKKDDEKETAETFGELVLVDHMIFGKGEEAGPGSRS